MLDNGSDVPRQIKHYLKINFPCASFNISTGGVLCGAVIDKIVILKALHYSEVRLIIHRITLILKRNDLLQ